MQRVVLHVDMDAFYAAVEQRDNPALRGLPVVVGGSPDGRGVVAAASYEARRFGIHSAMPAAEARRRCPQAVFVRSRIGYYAEISRHIHSVFARFTPQIEPLALDEAFLDASASRRLFGEPLAVAKRIKTEIKRELGLVASVGVAPNKFVAKLASDLHKPDGLVVVEPHEVLDFLAPLPVNRLWGVGKVSSVVFARMGIATMAELRTLEKDELTTQFGKWGGRLWELAHGLDDREVIPDAEAKSISHETTFDQDIANYDQLRACLLDLTEQVMRRLRRAELRARTVAIKVRYASFETPTRRKTLSTPTDSTRDVYRVALKLLRELRDADGRAVRLLGMGVSGFASERLEQQDLFAEGDRSRQRQIDSVADAITQRFGQQALGRGGKRS